MFFCGMVENLPHWPWENKRFTQKKSPRLRTVHTRMSGAFFHKGITRFEAEMFLTNAKDDGSFLVRDSESLSGAYVLCLLHQSKVHQYRVLPSPDRKLHVQSETGTIQRGYGDLTELIAEYIKKGDQNGLACALIHPIPPESGTADLDSSDNSEDEDFESPPPVSSPPAVPPHRMSSSSKPVDPNKVDLHRNLAKMDLAGCDSTLCQALREYADNGVQRDMVSMNVGESELPEFTKLLEVASQGLKRELDSFIKKMDIINDFLKVSDSRFQSLDSKKKLTGPVIPSMLEQLSRVRSDILNVQTKAQETVQLASIPSDYEFIEPISDNVFSTGDQPLKSGPFLSSTYRPYIPQSKFEVKKIKHSKPTHPVTLTVDLQNGRYSILKQASRDALDQTTIPHEKILHLIKSTKDKCHLDIILDGKKKQTYAFNDHHARENFCLQIRQMKNMHSTETEIDQISIFAGSWNMGDTSPNQSLSTWLKCSGPGISRDRVLGVIPHDMYVIGTQESSMTEKDWVNTVKAGLKACVLVDMELVEVCTLWGIRLVILVKPEHKHCISRVQRSSVRTGIANALGNKGAVGISFYFNGTSFCFVNAHLTSGDERCVKRNQNYRDIIKGLTMSMGPKHLTNFDITNEFHHVFFLGDLNYRVEEKIPVILSKIVERDLATLIEKDQLKSSQKNKTAFCGFDEADITFLPTYRLERNSPGYKYAWRKIKRTGERHNAPSWCDRVLWRSYPGLFIENVAYGASDMILSSDHRPVFSSFNVGISSEFVQARGSLTEMVPVKIIFHSIEAQVKTCCKQYFQVMFYSSCLQEIYKSEPNIHFQDNRTGFYTVPYWQSDHLPEMKPLFGDQDFLEDQHILIAVISRDADNESYGECVLSLKDMFSSKPKEFEYMLLHQGEETGTIKGKMHVTSKSRTRSSSKKSSYSLITFDTEYQDPEVFLPDRPSESRTKIARGNTSSMKPHSGGAKQPLRKVQSSFTDAGQQYDSVEIRNELESRAPQPLPTTLPVPPPRKNPVMGQSSLLQGTVRVGSGGGVVRQTSSPPISNLQAPPPVPPKSRSIKGKETDKSAETPRTVEEWLAQLNLSCYEQNFSLKGWKSLLDLNKLSVQNLVNMQIDVPDHQERILASVRDLNKDGKETVDEGRDYALAKVEVDPPNYAILLPEVKVKEGYIEFEIPCKDSHVYDSFQPMTTDDDDDDSNVYDTFREVTAIEKERLHLQIVHENEQEDMFMSLDELQPSPAYRHDDTKRATDSTKDTEDVFMSLDQVKASPVTDSRAVKSRSLHFDQRRENTSATDTSSHHSRHSQPAYYNLHTLDGKQGTGKMASDVKDHTKTEYYNIKPLDNDGEDVFMSLEELQVSHESDDQTSDIYETAFIRATVKEQPGTNVYDHGNQTYDHGNLTYDHGNQSYKHGDQTYDHGNQKTQIKPLSGYDHVYFTGGKPMTTVEEWLKHLDMLHYKHNFMDNGWDSLCFLHELTATDLTNIGVLDAEEHCVILQSVKSLN